MGVVFQEYREWMERMKLTNLGSLNNAVMAGKMSEITLISEALHERRIADIASTVAQSWNNVGAGDKRIRVVLIAGPSSSGKTTFAKRLGVQLLANGIRPYALSLDNYFLDREQTPRTETGDYDFEALHAINLTLLNEQLVSLLDGQEVVLPTYNFVTGRSEVGETVRLEPNQVLIIEGIHGLNPQLTTAIPNEITLHVYVSVLTHLNLDRHNRIATSDVRLLRRIVRDHQHRGYSASDTIERWESVRRGERHYIFPYQGNADVIFNSALLYELSVLKPIVEPLLLQIEWDTPAYVEARRLLAFLRWVRPVEADFVPDNSIIREFIGGSILRHFSLL
jgi:uridine kinase